VAGIDHAVGMRPESTDLDAWLAAHRRSGIWFAFGVRCADRSAHRRDSGTIGLWALTSVRNCDGLRELVSDEKAGSEDGARAPRLLLVGFGRQWKGATWDWPG
jgi:hypothetical protein